jgi:NAD(P)-dependent dehydrogenase (short-subunit alcohol dehydrogenase family)
VVTGGGQGIGRAVAERLLADGDAADEAVTGRAADLAQQAGRPAGW